MPPILPPVHPSDRSDSAAGRTSRPPSGRCARRGRVAVALLALVVPVLVAGRAHAGCNLIPSAEITARGALGATNRPFAATRRLRRGRASSRHAATRCRRASAPAGDDHVVSVVFKPTGGPARVVFLTADACSGSKPKALRAGVRSTTASASATSRASRRRTTTSPSSTGTASRAFRSAFPIPMRSSRPTATAARSPAPRRSP